MFTCAALPVFGQAGLHAGFNRSTAHLKQYGHATANKGLNGLQLGVFYRSEGRRIAVQPTLSYTQKGAKDTALINTSLKKYDYHFTRLNYLELAMPVLLRFRFQDKSASLDLGAGPYVARLLRARSWGREYINGGKLVTEYHVGNGNWNDFSLWDAGLSMYAGFTYRHFGLSAGYTLGLMDVCPKISHEIKNRNLSIRLMLLL